MNDRAASREHRLWILALGVLSILVLWTYRQVLSVFFSADDLIHLEQAAGVLPTPWLPWRIVTQVAYFRGMLALVGPVPPAFMLINLALHTVNVVLVTVLAGRLGLSRAARLTSAAVFGIHVVWFTVIGHAVIINDLLALTCGLMSVLAATRPDRARTWRSVGWFAFGLLCKESIAALPLALLALPSDRRPPGFTAARRALIVTATVFAASFGLARVLGWAPAGTAYELGWFPEPFHNAMTYLLWLASPANPLADRVRSLDPSAWTRALPLLVAAVALGVSSPRSRPATWFGLAWWLAGLAPVLPLRNSAYAHYMVVATPGIAIVLTTAIWAAMEWLRVRWASRIATRFGSPRWGLAGAVVFAATLAILANATISRRLVLSLPGLDLPLDPALRSMVVAGRAVLSVGQYLDAGSTRLAVITPPAQGKVFGARSGREMADPSGGYDLHRVVLDDGRALRVFYPQIQLVRFEDRWSAELAGYDVFLRRADGFFRGFGRGPAAMAAAGRALAADGQHEAARELLTAAAQQADGSPESAP